MIQVLAGLTVLGAIACSSAPEDSLLQNYFRASRARDNATLANIATVSFNPNQEGIVQSFRVVSATPDQKQTLRIKELSAALQAAQQADESLNKTKKDYQDANIEAIDRVLKVERAGQQARGKDAEVLTAWSKWRQEAADSAKKVNDAKAALSAERSVAEASVSRSGVNIADFDAELTTRDVTIAARVRPPQGPEVDRTMQVRIQKADLKGGPAGQQVEGRWIITRIADAS